MESLVAALDELAEADPVVLAERDSIVALHAQLARLEAIAARASAAFDASGVWAEDGARTAAAWVRTMCRLPDRVAKRRVRLGRAVRHLPHAEAAWLAGDITADQVALLARARNERTAQVLDRDEEQLVAHAKELRFAEFQRLLARWCQLADPDGEEARAAKQVEDRRFDLSQTFQGAWVGDLVLDPVSGTILNSTMRMIEDELFHADWAEARARLGRDPLVTDLARTPKQRRADALVEMAIRARTAPKDGKRPAPLFTVLIGYETFAGRMCELASRTVVTPGSLLPYLDDAYLERVVFDTPSRVIDVSEQTRLFKGATRRAVQVRDRECDNRFCDTPAEDTQIDHIQPHAAGGPTTTTNGRCLCAFHNRLRDQRRRPDTG